MKLSVLSSGSKGNCYILSHDNDKLLLDSGIGIDKIRRGVGYDLASLQSCLISHQHQDHAKAGAELVSNFVECLMSQETATALGIHAYYPNVTIDKGGVTSFGKWMVKSFPLEHDVDGTLGFMIGHQETNIKTAYITDSGYCQYNPVGIHNLIIECNYIDDMLEANYDGLDTRYVRLKKYHMSLERVKSYIKKIGKTLNNVVLVHLSEYNSDEQRMLDEVKAIAMCNVYVAHDGDEIDLDDCPF